jgi:hypothetical protein
MKVMIEVEEIGNNLKLFRHDGMNIYLDKEDCEPVQEGWLTEEQFIEIDSLIWRMCNDSLNNRIRAAIQKGWIEQSKPARQKTRKYYKHVQRLKERPACLQCEIDPDDCTKFYLKYKRNLCKKNTVLKLVYEVEKI